MENEDRTESEFPILDDQERKTVLLLRWILIIVVGYLIVFSHPDRPLHYLPYGLFLFLILLVDIGMTSLAAYVTARVDSGFYLIYFLILFIASYSRKPKFLYFTAAILLMGYALYSYLEYPDFFRVNRGRCFRVNLFSPVSSIIFI